MADERVESTFEVYRTMYEPVFVGDDGIEKRELSFGSGVSTTWEESTSDLDRDEKNLTRSSAESSSSAYASLKKCYEQLPMRESRSLHISSPETSSPISSVDDRRTRRLMHWCEAENEVIERSLAQLNRSDKELKKWLRGSRKLLKDFRNPRRKSAGPPSEEMRRAEAAATLASEAVQKCITREGRISSVIPLEGNLTSTAVRCTVSLYSFGEYSNSEMKFVSAKSLSCRKNPRPEKVRSTKKPQFSSATEIIPDTIQLDCLCCDNMSEDSLTSDYISPHTHDVNHCEVERTRNRSVFLTIDDEFAAESIPFERVQCIGV